MTLVDQMLMGKNFSELSCDWPLWMGHVICSSPPSPPTHVPSLCYLLDPQNLVEFVSSAPCDGLVKKKQGGGVGEGGACIQEEKDTSSSSKNPLRNLIGIRLEQLGSEETHTVGP